MHFFCNLCHIVDYEGYTKASNWQTEHWEAEVTNREQQTKILQQHIEQVTDCIQEKVAALQSELKQTEIQRTPLKKDKTIAEEVAFLKSCMQESGPEPPGEALHTFLWGFYP